MNTRIVFQPVETLECDALVMVAFEGQPGEVSRELYESKEFNGKLLELALLHRPAGLAARRLLLVGGGKAEAFTASTLRKAAGTALRHLKAKSSRNISMVLAAPYSGPEHVAAAVEGAI